jgi:hypothetical protein
LTSGGAIVDRPQGGDERDSECSLSRSSLVQSLRRLRRSIGAPAAYAAGMADETFQDLVNRLEAIAVRIANDAPELSPALTRDELVDVLDLLRRVANAMLILQARGNLR